MQDEKYINMAINTFNDLKMRYNLKLVANEAVLNYSNNIYSFSLYLEKHFEFYICFHLNHVDLRLYDLAKWLCLEKNDIILLTRNQVANEADAKFVLSNLCIVLEKILNILERKPNLLLEFSKKQKSEKMVILSDANLSLIRQAWETKQFEKFLTLVDCNRDAIKQSKSAAIILRQEAYAKKIQARKTGDGSLS